MLSLLLAAALSVSSPTDTEKGPGKGDVRQVETEVGDLSGYYTCKGREAGGKAYNGVALLLKKNDVYLVQWMVGGGAPFTGLGIRQGDNFAVSWAMPADKGGVIRGINLYRVEAGPRLVGRWASLPGPGILQSETLIFLKKVEPEE